jgi:C-terminal processing protease CtpA/Prc
MDYFKNKLQNLILLSLVIGMVALNSCKKDKAEVSEATKFVYDYTNYWYLWNDSIPADLNISDYPTPENLFEAMRCKSLDKWSYISDNYSEVLNSLNGIETSTGYIICPIKYPSSNNIYGILEYVYDGSPADEAGLKRGDIVIKVNGQTLNTDNYSNLLSLKTLQLGLGQKNGDDITDLGISVNVTAELLTINPVQQHKVIDVGGKKIGYLLYDQFTEDITGIQNAISYFSSQGINDLVLDLRYNPGGYVSTCSKLASMVAPSTAINDTFIVNKWNVNATQYLKEHYGANSEMFIKMLPTVPVNLNLSRMVVLTSMRTASASELIINGLEPYMDIITIGDNTIGKYTSGIPFYDESSSTNTYCIYLIVNKTANAKGITDYKKGFAPDYLVFDNFTTPLGDTNEKLLAKAIEVLTGTPKKNSSSSLNFIPYGKIDRNLVEKHGLMINDFRFPKSIP